MPLVMTAMPSQRSGPIASPRKTIDSTGISTKLMLPSGNATLKSSAASTAGQMMNEATMPTAAVQR